MITPTQMFIRAVACLAVACSVWTTPQGDAPPTSATTEQAITVIAGPLSLCTGVKVESAPKSPIPQLHIVIAPRTSVARPVCYTEPKAEPTRLVQFPAALARTALLTTCT